MNPSCDADEIAAAYEEDEVAARAEFGAEFRDDLVGFISEAVLSQITVDGRYDLPPQPGVTYYGFTDASGGGSDSMTIAVAHREDNTCVLDAMLEVRPPFNTDAVTREFGELARRYGLVRLISDKYALEWVRQRFAEYGVSLDQSARPKSTLFLNFLALANAGRVELLDHGRLRSQLASLRRRPGNEGKDSVTKPRDHHDDLANAVAGALVGLDLDRNPALARQTDMLTTSGSPLPLPQRVVAPWWRLCWSTSRPA